MSEVKIVDIQIRLNLEIDGVHLVASWYGPKDKMRFARVKSANRLLTTEETAKYEEKGKILFAEKIKEIEETIQEMVNGDTRDIG